MRVKVSEVNGSGGDKVIKLEDDAVLKDLLIGIGKDETRLVDDMIELKWGYPLTSTLVNSENLYMPLSSIGISNGERIILKTGGNNNIQPITPSTPPPRRLNVKQIPDDNSCLFHCLSLGIYGNMNYSTQIRKQISEYIQNHPDEYNDRAILDGKSIGEYCRWIEDYNSWGGYIEISIIPKLYENVTLWICDIINDYIDKISGADTSTQVIALLYNGVHYDLLECEGQTVFYSKDLEWLDNEGHRIMKERHDEVFDSRRSKIKCNQCGKTFTGEKDVSKHVMETSHSDFIQI